MTLHEIEDIKTESKEDKPVAILLDNKSAVDMTSASFSDTNHWMHILCRWHYVRSDTESLWHKLTWLSNATQVTYIITKILPKKDFLTKMCYAMTHISREYTWRLLEGCQPIGLHSLDTVLITVQDNIYTANLCEKILPPIYFSARVLI